MNFTQLNDLPVRDLMDEFDRLMSDGTIYWSEESDDQICINTIDGKENDFLFGRGSLYYDWDRKYIDSNGNLIVPERLHQLKESNFSVLCTQFKNTLFEEVYAALSTQYRIGRVRIMNLKPKTCLSWHVDDSTRIHYPMKTQEGCFMVIDNEVKHLSKNQWYHTNTIKYHSVFNGSKENRYHLVATVLE
jgi:hypothetical protein